MSGCDHLRERVARWLAPSLALRADRAERCLDVIRKNCFSTPNTGLSNPEDAAYVHGANFRSAQVQELLTEGWNGNQGAVQAAERDRIFLWHERRQLEMERQAALPRDEDRP